MSTDDELMEIGWNAIKGFIRDWQKKPYKWSYEAEIQAEIYRRLNSEYERINKNDFSGRYKADNKKSFIVEELENNQILNRVSCEPTLDYPDLKGKACAPDLVIWKEGDPSKNNMRKDWPILLMCEIKVVGRKSSGFADNQRISADKKKIDDFIKNRASYGCLLVFHYHKSIIKFAKNLTSSIGNLKRGEAERVNIAISAEALK